MPARHRPFTLKRGLLAILLAFPAQQALAATCTWNPASGNWNVPANWSCGFVPTNVDLAVIAFGTTVTVTGAQPTTSVSNDGTVTISNNSSIGLTGSNTNNGVIGLNSIGNATDLTINGLVSLNGTGSVQMSNTTANRIFGAAATLTLGAGQSILGSGQVGAATSMALVNNGTVAATQSQPLIINTTAGVTNNNVLRADGGTLVLQNTNVTQGALGRLDAINGSTVQLFNASVSGGSFTSSAGGAIATAGGTTSSLSAVTNAGTLNVVNNSFVNLDGNLVNNGTVNMQSLGNATDLIITGARTISGTGDINLSNTSANRVRGAGGTLTLSSGQTLQGAGTIGAGEAGFSLVNQGTVIATQSLGLLINAPAGVTNTGTLRADGGTLGLQSTINSGGGNIEARNGSQVQLLNGAVINNANFSATGAGSLITTVGGAQVTLGGGTVSGPVTIANNSFVRQTGDLVYNGTLSMASLGNATDLQIDGARSITGTATISLSNTQQNRFVAANGPGDQLTLGNNVTLQGAGQLGTGTALKVVNNGTMIASQSAGLLVETSAGLTNNGVMRADGGPLQFRNVVVESAGGTIEARNGSQVQLFGGTVINNANFAASGGGLITTVSGATVTLGGGTVSGPMTVANNSDLRLTADMTYNGVLSMGSLGNNTNIQFSGARALDGTATLNLSNALQNRLVAANALGDSAAFGSNITVQGAGQIGAGGALAVFNNGTWIANASAGMVLSTTAGATNNALIRGDGASFTIANTQLNQGASGVLNAINGGSVVLNTGSQINGGTFSTASGGEVAVRSGNTASIAGVTNTGTLNINNNSELRLNGNLTNNGSVNMQSLGNATDLRAEGNHSILGTGTITLSNALQNRILGVAAGDSLTLGENQLLQGAGQIGAGTDFSFTNNGTITANASSGMVLSATATATNNALIRGDGASFTIANTQLNQGASGVLNAINGGSVVLNSGSQINGGTFSTASAGEFAVRSGNTARIAGVTNTGTLNIDNNSELRLNGNLTNSGSVNMQSLGNGTDLRAEGNRSILGTGTITLSNTLQNRIWGVAAGDSLTLGAGQTLQGAGQIGAGTNFNFTNNGTVTANQSAGLVILTSGALSNAASGLMQGATGGTLNINSALANAGTLAADGGVVNANAAFNGTGTALVKGTGRLNVGAASTVGTLTHNGSAATGLALGANNITVSSDYTNANAGTGNAFNRRANVTGTGLIVAGGTAAQAITGTSVTNGNTANATLTLGNVLVGSTTFDSRFVNTCYTGPALRGAIQTNVNGGNLTDTRLSGAGVTASNYNAGAPGSNTGNLGVTFTAASAGALAPLTGQVLNLRSNFDNIADQKLNIVLGAGAAAYNAAVGNAASPVQVANQRIGGSNTATVAVTNAAAPGAFSEDLNASVGATSGATGSGSIIGRLAGASSGGGAITASVNSGSAGAKTGTITLNYETAGKVNGVSNGLGTASVGSQDVTVNGNVYQVAQPTALPASINLGNFRAGTAQSQTLTLTNTNISPAGFQEGLNASIGTISGAATGSGALNNVAAGASGTLQIGVTGVAGDNTGSVQVQLATNGTGTSGLGNDNLGGAQTINVSGTGYRLAQANAIGPINFGNVLANSIQTRTLTISNTATADGFSEALNAAFGNIGGANAASFTTKGVINGLLAGGNDNTSMVVTLNTSATGTKTANVQILLDSNGTAIGNGLGITALPTQTINLDGVITGVVGNLASAGLSPTTVNFGKFREGAASQTQQLTVSNLTQGPGEGLNASFGAANGGAGNNGGSITSLPTNTSDNTSMSVTLGGLATAGAKNGTQVLNFVSDGSFNNGVPTGLPSQSVDLSAEVYRLATAGVTTPINLAARRVGDAAATGVLTLTNTAANDGFSEGLRGTIGAAPAGFSVTGPANTGLIAAGGNTTRTVTLDTATAGVFGGSIAVALASDGAGTSGFAEVALPGQSTVVSGNVYAPAVAQLNTPNVNFGIVRVGDVVATQNVSVTNAATPTALNDTMKANVGAVTGPFSGSGSASGIGASASNAPGTLTLALATGAAGLFNGTASIGFASQNPEMAELGLGSQLVNLSAQVNNLANADFDKLSGLGTLRQTGIDYELDFGNVSIGALLSSILQLDNDVSVSDPADLLSGGFFFTNPLPLGFAYSGWNSFTGLDAGEAVGGLTIDFSALTAGQYMDEVIFGGLSTNGSGPDLAQTRRLTILANVIDNGGGTVPEPSSLALLLAAAVAGAIARRRQALALESRVQA